MVTKGNAIVLLAALFVLQTVVSFCSVHCCSLQLTSRESQFLVFIDLEKSKSSWFVYVPQEIANIKRGGKRVSFICSCLKIEEARIMMNQECEKAAYDRCVCIDFDCAQDYTLDCGLVVQVPNYVIETTALFEKFISLLNILSNVRGIDFFGTSINGAQLDRILSLQLVKDSLQFLGLADCWKLKYRFDTRNFVNFKWLLLPDGRVFRKDRYFVTPLTQFS